MSAPPDCPTERSLRRKLLLPLLLLGVVVAGFVIAALEQRSREQLSRDLQVRAELVGNMVNYAAESISSEGELQRIVSSIGAEKDVLEIVVVGGSPARVLAATRSLWKGKLLTDLPGEEVADDLAKAMRNNVGHHHFNATKHLFDASSPLLLSQEEMADGKLHRGAVMVHLDTRPMEAAIRASTVEVFSIIFVGFSVLTAVGYRLLDNTVLRPIAAVANAVSHSDRGEAAWVGAVTNDEIGRMARVLRDSLAKTDAALRELGNQKFALDQHAIVAVTNVMGLITYANDKFCEISGYARKELLGENHRILNSGIHSQKFFREMWKTIAQGEVWHGEICNLTKGGARYWTDATLVPLLGPDGKPTAYIAIRTDITARKAAEEKLRHSEERQELALAATDLGLWDWNVPSGSVAFDQRWCAMLGFGVDELAPEVGTWLSLLHPDDAPGVQEILHPHLRGDTADYAAEFRMRHEDGHWVWILAQGRVVERSNKGVPLRMAGTHMDISVRKQAESALKLSDFSFKQASSITFWIARDARILRVNQATCELLGYTETELLGMAITDLDPDFPVERWPLHWQELRERRRMCFETRQRHKDGHFIPIEMSLNWFEFEGQEYNLSFAQDITLRREADESLRLAELKFRGIVEQLPGITYQATLGETCTWSYVSPQVLPMLGYTQDEWLASERLWFEQIHPDDRAIPVAAEADGMRTGRMHSEYRMFTRAGELRWFRDQGVFVVAESGKYTIYGVMMDITEAKDAEAELAKAHKQLLEVSRAAGMAEVATNVLHNVGNVLNSVNVSANLVSGQIRKAPVADLGRVVTLLHEQGDQLGAFFSSDPRGPKVTAFLAKLVETFARERETQLTEVAGLQKNIEHIKDIVAAQQSYAKVSGLRDNVSPGELIEDAVGMNAASFQNHEVELVREIPTDLPPVFVDKHQVLQILINLLRNAKHACDDAGRAEKRITVRATHESGRVLVTVADTGVGIPRENLDRIFNHGFTTKKEGHGFGLHSAANAAKEMGGRLSVQSDGAGCGAAFTLELPIEAPTRPDAPRPRRISEPAEPGAESLESKRARKP
jgi:PAS domain S-box-containing protein